MDENHPWVHGFAREVYLATDPGVAISNEIQAAVDFPKLLGGGIIENYKTCHTDHLKPIDYPYGSRTKYYFSLAVIANIWNQFNDILWLTLEGKPDTYISAWEINMPIAQASLGGGDPFIWNPKFDPNLVADLFFGGEANLDMVLQPESPTCSRLSCFQEIPIDQISIQQPPSLIKDAVLADEKNHLNWDVTKTLPPTLTWTIP